MVVDTSALIAIVAGEPERDVFFGTIKATPSPVMSAATAVEFLAVAGGRWPNADPAETLRDLIQVLDLTIVPVDIAHAWAAGEALARYGKGRHSARLNYGDSFAYATASLRGEPLLFKGNDFTQTDIKSAI